MTRIRTIKPDFFGSPDTASASFKARLLYVAMWCWADDYGVGRTNLQGLAGFAFEHDDTSASELQSLLSEVRGSFGVVFYSVGGRYYYSIPSWDDHQKTQRRANRRDPGPDDPEAVPDQRFNEVLGHSEGPQGDSEPTQGNAPSGRGRGKGRGTGEEEGESSAQARTPHAYSDEFETFWAAYPRRESKRQAWKAWGAATKRATPEAITEGALRYAQDPNREGKYTKHAATWLNADGWEDDALPSRNVQELPRPSKSRGWLDAGQSMTNGGGLRAIGN